MCNTTVRSFVGKGNKNSSKVLQLMPASGDHFTGRIQSADEHHALIKLNDGSGEIRSISLNTPARRRK